MADQRQGDRRAPEQGVVKIKTKDVVGYSVLLAILLISVILNVVLGIKNAKLNEDYDDLLEAYYYENYYGDTVETETDAEM